MGGSGHLPKLQRDRSATRARSISFRGRAVTRVAPGIRRQRGRGAAVESQDGAVGLMTRGRGFESRPRWATGEALWTNWVEPWSFQRRVQAGAGMELERESKAAEKEGWRARQSRRRWRGVSTGKAAWAIVVRSSSRRRGVSSDRGRLSRRRHGLRKAWCELQEREYREATAASHAHARMNPGILLSVQPGREREAEAVYRRRSPPVTPEHGTASESCSASSRAVRPRPRRPSARGSRPVTPRRCATSASCCPSSRAVSVRPRWPTARRSRPATPTPGTASASCFQAAGPRGGGRSGLPRSDHGRRHQRVEQPRIPAVQAAGA